MLSHHTYSDMMSSRVFRWKLEEENKFKHSLKTLRKVSVYKIHVCHSAYMEVRGQLEAWSSLFVPCGSLKLNTAHQVWQAASTFAH